MDFGVELPQEGLPKIKDYTQTRPQAALGRADYKIHQMNLTSTRPSFLKLSLSKSIVCVAKTSLAQRRVNNHQDGTNSIFLLSSLNGQKSHQFFL